VLDTVRAYVRHVRSAKSGGHLLLTGSENSVAIPPFARRMGLGLYGITKHAVLHMGDTLRYELQSDGIGVSVLLPGPVATQILSSNRNRPETHGGPKEGLGLDLSLLDMEMPMTPQISPEAAARIAVEGLRAERFLIPTHSHLVAYAQGRLDELASCSRDSAFEPDT
jgi:short-subunit dehydrogenase